jgi:putative transposase
MGSVGDAYDNAVAESFFATLETELIDRHSWRTRADARLAVFDFIEAFYNPHRRHRFIVSCRQPSSRGGIVRTQLHDPLT